MFYIIELLNEASDGLTYLHKSIRQLQLLLNFNQNRWCEIFYKQKFYSSLSTLQFSLKIEK